MEIDELLGDGGFYILCGVGLVAFFIMNMVLKGMDSDDIMPFWIKIAVILFIPVGAGVFRILFSSD